MKICFDDMADLAQSTARDIWGSRDPAKLIEKLKEEVEELGTSWDILLTTNPATSKNKLDVMKELGDVLFCVMRFAYNIEVKPEDALTLTIVKIQERDKFDVAGGIVAGEEDDKSED